MCDLALLVLPLQLGSQVLVFLTGFGDGPECVCDAVLSAIIW